MPPSFFSSPAKAYLLVALCSLLASLYTCQVANASPSWLKIGAHVRYEGSSGKFEWTCADLVERIAEMKVTFLRDNAQPLTTTVYIDVESRGVTLPNGTYLGKTALWLVVNPADGQIIDVDENVSGKVLLGGWLPTLQGAQKGYILQTMSVGGFYDLDTGILLHPSFLGGDSALSKIGFPSPNGEITQTNIDLGPREWFPEIIMATPYILIIVAITLTALFVYRRRAQRKAQKRALDARRKNKQSRNRPETSLSIFFSPLSQRHVSMFS